jgi:hypothetical protein
MPPDKSAVLSESPVNQGQLKIKIIVTNSTATEKDIILIVHA